VLSLLPHPKSCGNRYRCLVTSLEAIDFIELKFILMQDLTYLLRLIFCISNQKGNESMSKFLVILLPKDNTQGSYTYLKVCAKNKTTIKAMFCSDYHIAEINKI
jgi:hypothetical protein